MLEARAQERIRWRCRRGMLELDLILSRFSERHLAGLDAAAVSALDTLLMYPDNELFDFVMGKRECADPCLRPVLELMQRS